MFETVFSQATVDRSDVIVVGSGLAALPLAFTLADRNLKVLLIESGERFESEKAKALTETYDFGPLHDGYWARHWIRAVGGTSRRWTGWLAPLDRRDLEQNNLDVQWPMPFEELSAYYTKAATFLQRPTRFTAYQAPFLDTDFHYKPFSLGAPIRAHEAFADRLNGDPNLVVLTCHTAVKLGASHSRKFVSTLHLHSGNEPLQLRLSPRQTLVLACGGLGNAQVLLQPAHDVTSAVGNESGLAGCFLMEHPHTKAADLLLDRRLLPVPPDDFGTSVGAFIAHDAVYKQHGLLACTLGLAAQADQAAASSEELELQQLFGRQLNVYSLYARSEQEPIATNGARVVNETDWAGSYKLEVHHCYSARDLRSIEQSARLFGENLAARRIGSIKVDNESIYRRTTGGGHTMGTTRMGTNVRNSVCDRNQKVHGFANLYLAGSSVFPTSGASNPTLTIVALSFRLADHLLARRSS